MLRAYSFVDEGVIPWYWSIPDLEKPETFKKEHSIVFVYKAYLRKTSPISCITAKFEKDLRKVFLLVYYCRFNYWRYFLFIWKIKRTKMQFVFNHLLFSCNLFAIKVRQEFKKKCCTILECFACRYWSIYYITDLQRICN